MKKSVFRRGVLCLIGVIFLGLVWKAYSFWEKSVLHDIQPVVDQSVEWTQKLASDGKIIADLNGDKLNDCIQMEYIQMGEGEQRISEVEVYVAGYQEKLYLSKLTDIQFPYDASFEKLVLYDLDQNGVEELLLIFDIHKMGGRGSSDIFAIWIQYDCIECIKMNTSLDKTDCYHIDDIYYVEKIVYRKEERLLVRQYVYGDRGHADGIGERVAIVSLGDDKKSFDIVETWME